MPNYLRTIVKKRWDTNPDVPWLKPLELKADALKDLPVSDGALSIWEISEEIGPERVAIALAATRGEPGNFDYVTFEGSSLQHPDFPMKNNTGGTPDDGINGLHYDLEMLTTHKLAELADIMSKGNKNRILQKRVKEKILQGLDNGQLDYQKCNQDLLRKLGRA